MAATRGRRITVGVLLAIFAIVWFVGILAIWVQRQALNTDNWVNTSSRLLRDEKIRTAVGTLLVDRLYTSAGVEQQIRAALPPQLKGLASPAAAGINQVALRSAPRILGSNVAQTAWEDANRSAHKVLLKVLGGSNGEVTLDLQSLLRQVAAGTGLPASAADKLPPNLQHLTVLKSDELATAQDGVKALKALPWILAGISVLLIALAIYLSPKRRRTVVTVGWIFIGAAVAVLAVRHLGGGVVVNHLAKGPNARPAVHDAWGISTSLLVDAAEGSMLFGFFVVTGAWLAGAGRRATAIRRASAPTFRERPAAVYAGLGALILLLILWGPVPWTQKAWTLLVFTVGAVLWMAWIRRRTLEEFPDVPSGDFLARLRADVVGVSARVRGSGSRAPSDDSLAQLERLASLHDRGVLDDAEFERQKAALLAPG